MKSGHNVDLHETLKRIETAIRLAEDMKPPQQEMINDLKAVKSNVEALLEDFAGAPPGYIQKTADTVKKWVA